MSESKGELIIYQTEDGLTKIDVRMDNDTVWLSLEQMAELFQRDKSTISRHIKNVFQEGELSENATVANFATVQSEGDRQVSRNIISIKESSKRNAKLRREVQKLSHQFEMLTSEEKQSTRAIEAKKGMERAKTILTESEDSAKKLKSARNSMRRWVVIQLAVSIAFSYVIGFIFLSLLYTTSTIEKYLRSSHSIISIILLDLALYFLPAYFKSRCTGKKYENGNVTEEILELFDSESPKFPFDSLLENGIKPILSDKKLMLAAWQIIAVTVILLFMMSSAGTVSAEQKRDFPIFEDEQGAFAVVYTSGTTRFMEEITINDETIVIDTSKQRVITSDDISYHIEVFESVSVISVDTEDTEKKADSKKSILEIIESYVETLKSMIREVMIEDAECISGS